MQNILQNLQAKFDQLEDREKLIVILGSALLFLIIYFFGFWSPSQERANFLQNEITLLQEDVAWMQANSQRVQSGTSTTTNGLNRSLLALLDERFKAAGLFENVVSIQRDGNTRASVRLEDAPFDSLVNIIATLESSNNTLVTRVSLKKAENTGRVSGTLVFDRS